MRYYRFFDSRYRIWILQYVMLFVVVSESPWWVLSQCFSPCRYVMTMRSFNCLNLAVLHLLCGRLRVTLFTRIHELRKRGSVVARHYDRNRIAQARLCRHVSWCLRTQNCAPPQPPVFYHTLVHLHWSHGPYSLIHTYELTMRHNVKHRQSGIISLFQVCLGCKQLQYQLCS